jgi:hypothetical protein
MIDAVEWTVVHKAQRKWYPTNELRWFARYNAGQVETVLQQLWTFEYIDKKNLPPDAQWEFGNEWRDVPTVAEEVPTLEQTIRTTILKEEAA